MINKALLILILSGFSIFSQSIEQNLLSKLSVSNDIGNIKVYNQLCWKLRSNNPKKSISYGNKAIDLINKINQPKLLSKTYNFLGVTYRNSGNYSKALYYYNRALRIASQYSDSLQIAYSHNNLGGIYRLEENNSLSLEHMLLALKYFKSKNDLNGIGFCTINLGIVYQNIGDFDKALEYLNTSLKIRRQIKNKHGEALTLYHIATTYLLLKNYSLSYKYFNDLMLIFKTMNDKRGIASCYEGFSTLNYLQEHYKKALKQIKKSKSILVNISDKRGIIRNFGKIALTYAQLKKFNLGELYLDSASVEVRNLKVKIVFFDLLKAQINFYKIKKDYKKALKLQDEFIAIKDSISAKENAAYFSAMQKNLILQQKEEENLLLKKEASLRLKERNYLVIIVFLGLILIVVIFIRIRAHKILSKELRIANATKDKFLNIIAHDLRNPFNTSMAFIELLLKDYGNLTDKEKIEILNETKNSFGKNISLLENLLEWSLLQRERVTCSPELINLKDLIDETVNAQRNAAKIKTIKIKLELENIEYSCDSNMIGTAVRNILSNAIKFTVNEGVISIILLQTKEFVQIKIKDSGVGIDSEDIHKLFKIEEKLTTRGTNNEPGSGLGLILSKDFVELNGGTLSVESEINKGSTFIITLPVQ